MSTQTMGLLIGGLLPCLMFAFSGLFSKSSLQIGIGLGLYIMIIGVAVMTVGALMYVYSPDRTVSFASGSRAFASGLCWGVGAGATGIALGQLGVPLSKIVPIYNSNTLIVVLLSLVIFAEWKQVRVADLLVGTVLIVAGTIFVSRA